MTDPDVLAAWERLASEHAAPMILFRPRYDRVRSPRTGEVCVRLVLETPDWVNVIPVTPDGDLVMVRQYRFGTGIVTTEIPGGVVEPGEDPRACAERELREETGYTSESWTYLGAVEPNPAFQDNRCHHFLARDVRLTHAPSLDDGEDVAVVIMSPTRLVAEVHAGRIAHSLVITALSRVLDLRQSEV